MRYNDKYRVVCCDPRTGARWLELTVFTAHMVSACAVPHSDWDWLSSTHSATCRALTWPGPLIPSPAQSEISALTDKLTTTISNILPPLRWPARASSCFYDQSVRQAASDYFSYSSLLQLVVRPPSIITYTSFSPLYLWSFLTIQMRYLAQNK